MNKIYIKKPLAVAVILLFISVSVIPSTGIIVEKKATMPTLYDGNTLYVGGNGTGNYSRIQDAIDNASNDDTVFVYDDSSPYYENVVVNKTINLIGEDRNTTFIDGNYSGHVVYVSADWVNISRFTIRNGWDGIDIRSNNSTITSNNISNNEEYGIFLRYCSNNNITGNKIILNNDDGIRIYKSSNNTIAGNNISSNNDDGIYLYYSNNSNVLGNSFSNDGLSVFSSYHNTVENNMVNGKPLVYLESESDIVIDEAGQVILIKCDNITVQNQELSNMTYGIDLWSTNNCLISGNTLSSNDYDGIRLYKSRFNTIMSNNISNNRNYGIYFRYCSSNNNITSNYISNNKYGISLWEDSSSNNITGNNITSNNWTGIYLDESNSNNITGNNITSNRFYYGGIRLKYSNSNNITGNTISNNTFGICLYESSYNNITGNTISNNHYGIYIYTSSNYNTIAGNTIISNNKIGIFYGCSNNNNIYHNNFINNTLNAYDECNNSWDNGYPSGGNYWSDYTGIDSDGDGIGDTPYNISGGSNQDRYPLMSPYDEEPPNVEITKPVEALYFFNLKVRPYLFRKPLIIGSIDIKVDASDDISGIECVEFYIDGKLKSNDTSAPYSWKWRFGGFIKHRRTIKVVAIDNSGNNASAEIKVWKFF